MNLNVALERTAAGTWVAEVLELPGVQALGEDRLDALRRVQARVLRFMARQLEEAPESTTTPPRAEMRLAFSIV